MNSVKFVAYGLAVCWAVAPLAASATYVSPPQDANRVYNDVDVCTGKIDGATRSDRIDACSDIIDTGRLSGKSLGAIYEARGAVRQSRNDYKLAIADYNESLTLNPDRSEVLINRGSAHLANGEEDVAIADYTKALTIKSDSFWAYYNRGVIYSFKKKDFRQAMDDLNKAIKLDPTYAPAYSTRGMVNNQIGNYRQAIADHDKAITLRPTSAPTYEMRAATYLSRKDYSHAIADYSRAHELAPDRALALFGLGVAEFRSGLTEKGQEEMAAAKKLKPDIDQDFEKGSGLTE